MGVEDSEIYGGIYRNKILGFYNVGAPCCSPPPNPSAAVPGNTLCWERGAVHRSLHHGPRGRGQRNLLRERSW